MVYYEKYYGHTFYENEQDIFKELIYFHGVLGNEILRWSIKDEQKEIVPTVFHTQKVFTIYYLDNGKQRKCQKSVFVVEKTQKDQKFFTVEEWLRKALLLKLSPKMRSRYSQQLNYFKQFSTIEKIKNNSFIFKENISEVEENG